jgi:hypothetical protein
LFSVFRSVGLVFFFFLICFLVVVATAGWVRGVDCTNESAEYIFAYPWKSCSLLSCPLPFKYTPHHNFILESHDRCAPSSRYIAWVTYFFSAPIKCDPDPSINPLRSRRMGCCRVCRVLEAWLLSLITPWCHQLTPALPFFKLWRGLWQLAYNYISLASTNTKCECKRGLRLRAPPPREVNAGSKSMSTADPKLGPCQPFTTLIPKSLTHRSP